MMVLAANCVGPCEGFVGAGGSAAWDEEGCLLMELGDRDEGLLVLDTRTRACAQSAA
jgi:predicted amidohydrolase